jgi:excisionase family DNA binding protein
MHDHDPDQLLTLGPAARLLELSQEATRRLVDAGTLPATRTSTGMRLVRRADVERLAAARRAK